MFTSTPPTLAGLFFCLASTRCRAFILPCCNTATYKRLQRVLCRLCSYTTHATKQRTGLYSGASCNLTHSTAANSRPTQAAIIPLAPRWSTCQRPDALHLYKIPPLRPDALQASTDRTIIIRYIRVQRCAPTMDSRLAAGGLAPDQLVRFPGVKI